MKNQKGYSIIEVIVATLALSIVFIPVTQSVMNGIKMHQRARIHLEYIYKAQEIIEEDRVLNSKKGAVLETTSTTLGNFHVKTTYDPVASGLLGEIMDFESGKDNYDGYYNQKLADVKTYNEAFILYDGNDLHINSSQNTSVFSPIDRLQIVITQVVDNKNLSVNRVGNDGSILNLYSVTILSHENNLNCYLSLEGVESASPILNLEIINNIVMPDDSDPNDIFFNVEIDEHNKLTLDTVRSNVKSGNIILIEGLGSFEEVYTSAYENDSTLLEMNIDVQNVAPDGTYSIQQIETLQKND